MRSNSFNDVRVLSEAIIFAGRGEPEKAVKMLSEHEFGSGVDVLALILKARILEELSVEEAWRIYSEALKKYPEHAALNLSAGVFAYKRGDIERAVQLLMHSWSINPLPEASYYLGIINWNRSHREKAIEFFVHTIALEGEQGRWRSYAEAELQGERNSTEV